MITAIDAEGLNRIVHGVLVEVFQKGRREVAALSPVSNVLRAHDLRSGQEQLRLEKENRCPSSVKKRGGEDQWRLRSFSKESSKASPPAVAVKQKSERVFITPKTDRMEEDEVV